MKNKIVELNDGTKYYVLEETSINGKDYICAVIYDEKRETLNEDAYYILERKNDNGKITFVDIPDAEANKITSLMFDKMNRTNA